MPEIKPGDIVHDLTVHAATYRERPGGAFGPAWVVLATREDTHGTRWVVDQINDRTGATESGGMTCVDQAHAERVYRVRAQLPNREQEVTP